MRMAAQLAIMLLLQEFGGRLLALTALLP
jgi:hypothetical protein